MKRTLPTYDNRINPLDHDRLVMKLARQFGAKERDITESDQYADGWLGLLKACERFNPTRDIQFSTYAYHWIRDAITRPFHAGRKQALKRGPGKTTHTFTDIGKESELLFDNKTPNPFDVLAENDHREKIRSLLRVLPTRYREIVQAYYFEGLNYREIGERCVPKVSWHMVYNIVTKSLQTVIDHPLTKRNLKGMDI
jgi:RNA polymerase sigma factor (sigma-70 family)